MSLATVVLMASTKAFQAFGMGSNPISRSIFYPDDKLIDDISVNIFLINNMF